MKIICFVVNPGDYILTIGCHSNDRHTWAQRQKLPRENYDKFSKFDQAIWFSLKYKLKHISAFRSKMLRLVLGNFENMKTIKI